MVILGGLWWFAVFRWTDILLLHVSSNALLKSGGGCGLHILPTLKRQISRPGAKHHGAKHLGEEMG